MPKAQTSSPGTTRRTPPEDGDAGLAAARAWRTVVAIVGLVTLFRLLVLFASPLELYPDEAQYWLWSRTLAFGYVSKPPLVAWLIAATTVMGRDAEPFVRLSSPLIHAATALVLARTGGRLYGPWSGAAAGVLYTLSPGVALSAFVVSTDPALLLGLSLALWAYAALQDATGRARLAAAAGFGAALGLAFLAKYAALYAAIGLAAHLALSREARRAWTPAAALAALAAFAVLAAPNLIWNAGHGFATVAHTASNADWGGRRFDVVPSLSFLGAQFGVFGPIPFAVLLGAGGWLAWRRRLAEADLLLLCFALPPLAIILVEAFVARANANWAAAAYAPASVLVAAWLVRWRARRWLGAVVISQGVIVAALMIGLAWPALADKAGLANGLKRLRGWRETTRTITERAALEDLNGGLSAVAVDDRFLFNEAAYYGRGSFGAGGPPLKAWVKGAEPQNQAELAAPLTAAQGRRVLAVSLEGRNTAAMSADFARAGDRQINQTSLDLNHWRSVTSFLGEGYAPRPRGPLSAKRP
ncbi:MAG: glycosyltransferase family 39 protein [Proteobacteria bacterium]|nr:glycosyltransferase family 39 protein [Pseudomonadota bacterium]